jgi:hypothetical protein
MINFWTRLTVAAILTTSISGVCLAQSSGLPPLAPQPPGAPHRTSGPAGVNLPPPHVVQVNLPGQAVYDGGEASDSGITLSGWGAGTITQDDAHGVVAGKHSFKIESPGFYEGGTITFPQAIDLGDPTDTSKYIQVSLSLAADPKYPTPPPPADNPTNPYGNGGPQGPGGYGMQPPMGDGGMNQNQNGRGDSFTGKTGSLFKLMQYPGPYQGQQPPQQYIQQQPGGPGGPGGPGMPGGPGQYGNGYGMGQNGAQPDEDTGPPPPPAKEIHLVLTFDDGTQTDISRDVPLPEDMEDWFTIGFPLSKLGLKSGAATAKLAAITIASDNPTLINVGRIKLVTDTSPIQASTGGEKDVPVNEKTTFRAETTAGASTLSYQWDFDTKGPFVAQSDGRRVTHSYTKSGAYVVTLVVTDVDGIKSPVTTTSTIHVED